MKKDEPNAFTLPGDSGIRLDLAPNLGDVDVDRAGFDFEVPCVSPDPRQQFLAGDGPVGIFGQIGQDLDFAARERDLAGFIAALMSQIDSTLNSASTLFTMDLYQKFKPQASQHQLVWIGRVATVVMVLIGLAWIPVIQGGKGLYDYLQGVQAYLAPPIFVVFFFGVFMKRLNGKGCLAALIVVGAIGLAILGLEQACLMAIGFGAAAWVAAGATAGDGGRVANFAREVAPAFL